MMRSGEDNKIGIKLDKLVLLDIEEQDETHRLLFPPGWDQEKNKGTLYFIRRKKKDGTYDGYITNFWMIEYCRIQGGREWGWLHNLENIANFYFANTGVDLNNWREIVLNRNDRLGLTDALIEQLRGKGINAVNIEYNPSAPSISLFPPEDEEGDDGQEFKLLSSSPSNGEEYLSPPGEHVVPENASSPPCGRKKSCVMAATGGVGFVLGAGISKGLAVSGIFAPSAVTLTAIGLTIPGWMVAALILGGAAAAVCLVLACCCFKAPSSLPLNHYNAYGVASVL